MLKYISNKIEQWCTVGLKLPFAFDPTTNKPSITLLFPYVTFVMLFVSLVSLHFDAKLIVATTAVATVWVLSVIFYLMRKITKAKFDLDNKSFELFNGDNK